MAECKSKSQISHLKILFHHVRFYQSSIVLSHTSNLKLPVILETIISSYRHSHHLIILVHNCTHTQVGLLAEDRWIQVSLYVFSRSLQNFLLMAALRSSSQLLSLSLPILMCFHLANVLHGIWKNSQQQNYVCIQMMCLVLF